MDWKAIGDWITIILTIGIGLKLLPTVMWHINHPGYIDPRDHLRRWNKYQEDMNNVAH